MINLKKRLSGIVALSAIILSSCASMQDFAMRQTPDFIGGFLPGILKSNQAKLDKDPDNKALILETGSYYVMYANAFVQAPADRERFSDLSAYTEGRQEARTLYLKGADILNHGLELRFPGISEAIKADAMQVDTSKMAINAFLPQVTKEDSDLIYWDVAATLSAFALNPVDIDLNMKIRPLSALIKQVYKVNPDYNNGTLDDFFILFNASVPAYLGGDAASVPEYFKKAIEKSGGKMAGPYVSYADSVCIPAGDVAGFKENIEKALAINPNADRSNRLMNLLAQEKARWLLDNAHNLFITWED